MSLLTYKICRYANTLDRDSFGAVALEDLQSETRSASVITTTSSVFLVLDKEQYRRIASGQDSEDQIAFRVSLLKNISLFENADQEILEQLALKTRVKYRDQNSQILVT